MQDFNNHFTVVFPAVSSSARWEYNQSQEHLGTTVMPVNGWDSRSADMGPVSMILSGEPDPTEIESICFELKSDWAPIIHRGWDEPARDVVRSERQHAFHIGAERARQAAEWAVDGNTNESDIARVLNMLENGDPAVDDHLPAPPELSNGEFADGYDAYTLWREVTDTDYNDECGFIALQAEANGEGTFDACEQLVEKLDELMEAYRDGVFAFYHEACEAVLRHALGAQS
jgi:hypothetical protein